MALSPMMQQYLRIHDAYPDCLLLFRLGDFYELFFEDAKTASHELELTLTGKDCGLEERAPMCGVPYHSVNTYVEKLISKGYKVAICEQMEDPALAKGLVERDVVRVITAGTVTDPSMLEDKANNYLLCVYIDGKKAGIAYADVSTGEFYVMEPELNMLRAQIARVNPMEVICNDPPALSAAAGEVRCLSGQPQSWFQKKNAEEALFEHFRLTQLTSLGLDERKEAVCAVTPAAGLGMETVSAIAGRENVCRFLHVAVQSGSQKILAAMRRPYKVVDAEKLIKTANELMPNAGIGCDMMTGFPGELEIDFFSSSGFLKRLPFSNVHVFPYSERPGTLAAAFPDAVPKEIRRKRAHILADIVSPKRLAFAKRFLGKTVEIVVEHESRCEGWTGEYLFCRANGKAARKSKAKVLVTRVHSDATLEGRVTTA